MQAHANLSIDLYKATDEELDLAVSYIVGEIERREGKAKPAETQAAYIPGSWIQWTGGDCPVPPDTPVEFILRGSLRVQSGVASGLVWGLEGGILRYRVVE